MPNAATGGYYHGIAGVKISAIHNQTRTLMVVDQPAVFAYSWHQPQSVSNPGPTLVNNSMNMGVFVDGHVRYLLFYLDLTQSITWPAFYNPPASYEYQWGE